MKFALLTHPEPQFRPKALLSGFKKPGPDAMGAFRCVLISGPPGIGKTTAAHLVAKQHGYDVLELNASDVRSKKLLEVSTCSVRLMMHRRLNTMWYGQSAFQSKITDTTLSGFFKSDGDDGVSPVIPRRRAGTHVVVLSDWTRYQSQVADHHGRSRWHVGR